MGLLRNTFREADVRLYYDKKDAEKREEALTEIEQAKTKIEEAIDELDGLVDQDLLNEMEGAIGEVSRLVYEIRRDSGI